MESDLVLLPLNLFGVFIDFRFDEIGGHATGQKAVSTPRWAVKSH